MAVQTELPPWAPDAQTIGCAFVATYYGCLHKSPELLYRFYQDGSSISRADTNGVMTYASTLNDINEVVCSLNYKKCKTKLKTVDSQVSLNGGTIVLVTGTLIAEDNQESNFMQTFFLAPEGRGYIVLNDIFRFVDEVAAPHVAAEEVEDVPSEPAQTVADTPTENHATSHTEEVKITEEKATGRQPSDDEYVVMQSESVNGGESPVVTESITSEGSQEGTVKKSYASILTSGEYKAPATPVVTPAPVVTPVPEKQSVKPAGKPSKNKDVKDDAEGYSIYVRNLPMSMSPAGLEAEFKKFGAVKRNGAQVRSIQAQDFCYGFVEFVESSSMQNALKAKSMMIGNRKATVEVKRTTTRVANGTAAKGPNHNNGNFKGAPANSNGSRGYSNGGRANGSRANSNGGRMYVKSDSLTASA